MSRLSLLSLINHLESTIRQLRWRSASDGWVDYYADTNYSRQATEQKRQLVGEFLDQVKPHVVWDLGANIGVFSRIASEKGMQAISFDRDAASVERNYLDCATTGETNVLPLLLDLTNPSPGVGWENQERTSLIDRGPADTVLALALIHHLAIANNLPLERIAGFFSRICNSLIVEFVPKSDSQVQRLLATREDIFPDYTQKAFEQEFGRYFTMHGSANLADSERVLYLMVKRHTGV